jgi:Xaa-Pro aminopeptidase
MREREIEAMFLCEYAKEDISCEVLLVGSDERIAQYRHPVPSEKEVRKLVLLHPAAQKWGLHANVTRMVSFGAPSAEVEQKYEAANTVLAAAASRSIAGQSFAGILEAQKAAYAEAGFADEWRNHFQGGITGYILADATLCRDPRAVVSQGQTFDWFVTITGAKTEELVLSTEKGPQVLSAQGRWPVRSYDSFGSALELPVILVR